MLKQLFAFVGEEACVAGLRGYFAKHAWGNTRLVDLMSELELASGRDLAEWTQGWLDTAGTDRLRLEATGRRRNRPAGGRSGRHRRRARTGSTSASTTGAGDGAGPASAGSARDDRRHDRRTRRGQRGPAAGQRRGPHVRLGAARRGVASRPCWTPPPCCPRRVSRAVAVTTAWDMLVWGELAAADFVDCVTAVLPGERVDSVIEPYLWLAVEAADNWSPDRLRDRLLAQVADVCLSRWRRTRSAGRSRCARWPRPPSPRTRSPRCAAWSATTSTCAGAC